MHDFFLFLITLVNGLVAVTLGFFVMVILALWLTLRVLLNSASHHLLKSLLKILLQDSQDFQDWGRLNSRCPHGRTYTSGEPVPQNRFPTFG